MHLAASSRMVCAHKQRLMMMMKQRLSLLWQSLDDAKQTICLAQELPGQLQSDKSRGCFTH
jgi:hypothetical protein